MADETRVIKIEIDGGPDVDKAAQSVDKMAVNLNKNKQATKDNTQAFKEASPALDKMTGGAVSFAEGTAQMTKSALAFIATPLGAVIAAIGLAIGALIAYFKGSEDAQNKWNKIMLVGSSIIEQLMNFVEDLGGAIFEAFSNPKQAIEDFWKLIKENVVNRFEGLLELIPKLSEAIGLLFEGEFSKAAIVAGDAVAKVTLGIENASDKIMGFINTVTDAVNAGIEAGMRLADIQAQLDKDERALIVQRAQTALEVAKIREQAITLEGDARKEKIQEAIELERTLADAELAHAQLKLEQAQLELQTNGDDKDAKLAVAEATAAVIAAEAQRYEATLRFSKEIEAIDTAEDARKRKFIDDRAKYEAKRLAESKAANDKYLADLHAKFDAAEAARLAAAQKVADSKTALDETQAKAQTDIMNQLLGTQKVNYAAGFNLFKKGELAKLQVTTEDAAMSAQAALSIIPIVGPALGLVAYALTYAKGLAAIASIAGVNLGFAEGGFTGRGGKHDVAGVVHRGEYVVPANIVQNPAYAGYISNLEAARQGYVDGGIVTNDGTIDTNTSVALARALMNMPSPVVSWKEGQELGKRVEFKESVTSR